MFAVSIVFCTRNREHEIRTVLPMIVRRYQDADVELVCLDDNSTDDTVEVVRHVAAPWGPDRVQLLSWTRSAGDADYDWNPVNQHNKAVAAAHGEKILLQNAEIAYIDDVLEDLKPFCHKGQASFATVMACPRPTESPTFSRLMEVDLPTRTFLENIPGSRIPGRHTALIVHDVEATKANTAYRPSRLMQVEAEGFPAEVQLEEYCSVLRPVPWFFCGMIEKADWDRFGGYRKATLPFDLEFGRRMSSAGMRFAFCDTLALHLEHDKR